MDENNIGKAIKGIKAAAEIAAGKISPNNIKNVLKAVDKKKIIIGAVIILSPLLFLILAVSDSTGNKHAQAQEGESGSLMGIHDSAYSANADGDYGIGKEISLSDYKAFEASSYTHENITDHYVVDERDLLTPWAVMVVADQYVYGEKGTTHAQRQEIYNSLKTEYSGDYYDNDEYLTYRAKPVYGTSEKMQINPNTGLGEWVKEIDHYEWETTPSIVRKYGRHIIPQATTWSGTVMRTYTKIVDDPRETKEQPTSADETVTVSKVWQFTALNGQLNYGKLVKFIADKTAGGNVENLWTQSIIDSIDSVYLMEPSLMKPSEYSVNGGTYGGSYGGGSFGSPGAGGIIGDFPYYNQHDVKWGSLSYGTGTISSSGCGTTSLAMVLTGLQAPGRPGDIDKNGDGIVTPDETAAWSVEHGFRIPNAGTSWGLFPAAAKATGLIEREFTSVDQAINELSNGHPIIVSGTGPAPFTSKGHFIVLKGVAADGKVLINDPNSLANTQLTWDLNTLASYRNSSFMSFENPNITSMVVQATGYDLTYASCQKYPGDPAYGVTASGVSLIGKDIRDHKIAVDKRLIPLGTIVYLDFSATGARNSLKLQDGTPIDLNGYYTAVDTGGDIQQMRIDVFFGENGFWHNLALQFGRVNGVKVTIPKK